MHLSCVRYFKVLSTSLDYKGYFLFNYFHAWAECNEHKFRETPSKRAIRSASGNENVIDIFDFTQCHKNP